MKKAIVIAAGVLGVFLTFLLVLNVVTTLELKTEVVFDAPKEKVWEVLIDSDMYAEWNPFITSVIGEMKQGEQITNVMVNKGRETTFSPVITVFLENESLEWLGSALGGMFKGCHYFKLSETEEGRSEMVHGEEFSGLLSGLVIQIIAIDSQANFELMNEAMKKRIESAP